MKIYKGRQPVSAAISRLCKGMALLMLTIGVSHETFPA